LNLVIHHAIPPENTEKTIGAIGQPEAKPSGYLPDMYSVKTLKSQYGTLNEARAALGMTARGWQSLADLVNSVNCPNLKSIRVQC
jgi:hypothetical protein